MNDQLPGQNRPHHAVAPASHLVALVQDPRALLVYWFVGKERLRLLEELQAPGDPPPELSLRLSTAAEAAGGEETTVAETVIGRKGCLYWPSLTPNRWYRAEVLAQTPDSAGPGLILLTTRPVATPPDRPLPAANDLPPGTTATQTRISLEAGGARPDFAARS